MERMSISSDSLKSYALEELKKLSRIPSISFPGFDPEKVFESAKAVKVLLEEAGFQNVEELQIDGCFPYVVGDFIVDKKLPTVLLYAHHDVQPPLREELWKTPPFEPTEKDGRLYGRGTADDKAGVLVHAAVMKHFKEKSGKPPVNLKIVIEGEEEIGSAHLFEFLKTHKERLQSDVIIVTDTANINSGVPSITTSLRGLVAVDVVIKSLRASLHSGLWGGVVVDPVQTLVQILAQLTDKEGNVLLNSVAKIPDIKMSEVPLSREEVAEQAGVLKAASVPEDFIERLWNKAAFSINAIQASSEKLANNVICDRVFARVGVRIAPEHSAKEVEAELIQKLKDLCPDTVEMELKTEAAADGWRTDPYGKTHRHYFEVAEKALEKAYNHPVVYMGCGASIPFIQPFEKALQAPVLSLGIEDPYTLAHSENESLLISDFYKAIDGEILLLEDLAK